ncbi:transposase, IS4 family [Chitinophaga jiangningensis]|uniref:Transposase, IS4 family n=1 Tax=Chitinophaga jiangningensis TaxID=1419482 RepID=A0A1M7LVE0_9BACT|nr:IS1182 family transposase [Chitinophaga jiangningensis]SHM82304.1 transposase, IS4 family [Chitinophaga jiangningensis]
MPKGKTLSVVFKANLQHQAMLFPPEIGDMITENHPVRVVNDVIERIDISLLLKRYKSGGTSSYHPRMLLKVLIYSYINNIYSSRKIEEALGQNIHFMWLSGMSKPDHNTINRFRGERLQKVLQPIFTQVVLLLCEEGLLNIKELYTDGTKIESQANRYSFVWSNGIKYSKEKIKQQLNDLWKYAQSVAATELDDDTDPSGYDKIDSEKVEKTIAAINNAIKDKPVDKQIKQKLNYARRNWPSALKKYAQQEEILGTRNSYSKTDPSATFMRLKEDHMRNGQLKPAYNLQISTNNQYIVNYSLHQQTTDTSTLISHLQQHIELYRRAPTNITTDAGYGSEQNYQWLEKKRITAYVKHNSFDRNQHQSTKEKEKFKAGNLSHNAEKDYYTCPAGGRMYRKKSFLKATKNGFRQTITTYQARKCDGCLLRHSCHDQQTNRIIEVNHNLNRLKALADKRLTTKKGVQKRKQRCYDVEPVFANIKHNHGFKRFMLKGMEKVSIEMGLIALAHNLRKKIA